MQDLEKIKCLRERSYLPLGRIYSIRNCPAKSGIKIRTKIGISKKPHSRNAQIETEIERN